MDIHSSYGTPHCDTKGTITNYGDLLLFKYELTNILSFLLVSDKYNVSYYYTVYTFTIHTPENYIHFHCSHGGLYYHDCNPGKRTISMVNIVEWDT